MRVPSRPLMRPETKWRQARISAVRDNDRADVYLDKWIIPMVGCAPGLNLTVGSVVLLEISGHDCKVVDVLIAGSASDDWCGPEDMTATLLRRVRDLEARVKQLEETP